MHRTLFSALLLLAGVGSISEAHAKLTSPIAFFHDAKPADFCQVVRQDLLDGEFTQLEATHKAAQSLEARFDGGQTELEVFYDGLSANSCDPSCDADATLDTRGRRLHEWLDRKSDPATANLAVTRYWWQAAWTGRGCGYADEVTSPQWQLFKDRLKVAAGYARQIDVRSDPEAGHLMLVLARDFNLPRDQIDTVFLDVRKRYPTYFPIYKDYASMTLQKWSGRTDLTAPYVRSLTVDPGGDTGEVAYSIVAGRLAFEIDPNQLYTADTGFDWAKVRHAFATRERLYGLSAGDWTLLCYLAVAAQDRDAAQDALKHLDGEVAFWPRGVRSDFYRQVLPWIRGDSGQP
jgi:hypothetical protein